MIFSFKGIPHITFLMRILTGESTVISALNCTSSVRILRYLLDACFYSFMDILTQMVLRNCISIALGGKEKKNLLLHSAWAY